MALVENDKKGSPSLRRSQARVKEKDLPKDRVDFEEEPMKRGEEDHQDQRGLCALHGAHHEEPRRRPH